MRFVTPEIKSYYVGALFYKVKKQIKHDTGIKWSGKPIKFNYEHLLILLLNVYM